MFNSKRLWPARRSSGLTESPRQSRDLGVGGLLLAACVLAAVPARAQAPGTYASATPAVDCATGTTATITVSAGQLVVVWSTSAGLAATFTITDSAGQTYSVATGPASQGGRSGEIDYFPNSAALTSVSMTASTGIDCTLIVAAYSGMATTAVLDVAGIQGNASSTTCSSPSITTTNASDVIVGTCDVRVAETWTAGGTGCTSTVESTAAIGTANSAFQDCNSSATGTFQTNLGLSAADQSLGAIAAFKRAGGGPPPCPKTRLMMGAGC